GAGGQGKIPPDADRGRARPHRQAPGPARLPERQAGCAREPRAAPGGPDADPEPAGQAGRAPSTAHPHPGTGQGAHGDPGNGKVPGRRPVPAPAPSADRRGQGERQEAEGEGPHRSGRRGDQERQGGAGDRPGRAGVRRDALRAGIAVPVKAADRILLVEDKESLRAVLKKTLESEGFGVDEASDGRSAMDRIRRDRFAMVLTDLRLPRADGHEVLKAAQNADPEMPVILMTAFGTIRDAVSAMKAGAYDYLEKPVDTDHLLALVRRALDHGNLLRENTLLKERFSQELDVPEILGESPALKGALDQVRRVAPTDATVLLLGESGTGKELFARAVHHLSGRKAHSFFPINCAAIPENLLESELFGYEKGAFTGASGTKRGKFEIADKGTLFLDEIGDLSLGLQGKVLRV